MLVLICSGVVAYGVYVYIQDINESDRLRTVQTDSTVEKIEPVETEDDDLPSLADTEEAAFEQLDSEVEASVKTNLAQSIDETPSSTTDREMTMSVSFSSYDQAERTYSLGVIFTNNDVAAVSNCSLEIQASLEDSVTQTVQSIDQRNASGCRFNNVALDELPDPSGSNPWSIAIKGFNDSNPDVISLEKNVSSLVALNNLVGN